MKVEINFYCVVVYWIWDVFDEFYKFYYYVLLDEVGFDDDDD